MWMFISHGGISQFSGAKKFLELQNFHWPKITCFFFCVKFRLVSGGRPCVQFIRGLFAIFSSELFSKGKELAGELKSHELLNGCLLNCLFFNSLAGILPGHVEISPPIWVHPRWLLVAFLSLGWSLDPIQVDALDKGSATAGPRCRLVYAELSKYQVSNTWHPIDT